MAKLDEMDMRLLSALKEDASVSVPKLSSEMGVNASVVYSRIKRLQERGVIERFTIVVREENLGLKAGATVGLNTDPKQREAVLSGLEKVEGIRLVEEVTGRFDMLIELRGRSLEEVQHVVYEEIGKLQGVTHAEVFMEVSRRTPKTTFKLAVLLGAMVLLLKTVILEIGVQCAGQLLVG